MPELGMKTDRQTDKHVNRNSCRTDDVFLSFCGQFTLFRSTDRWTDERMEEKTRGADGQNGG